jgi:hypothetical protein
MGGKHLWNSSGLRWRFPQWGPSDRQGCKIAICVGPSTRIHFQLCGLLVLLIKPLHLRAHYLFYDLTVPEIAVTVAKLAV